LFKRTRFFNFDSKQKRIVYLFEETAKGMLHH